MRGRVMEKRVVGGVFAVLGLVIWLLFPVYLQAAQKQVGQE